MGDRYGCFLITCFVLLALASWWLAGPLLTGRMESGGGLEVGHAHWAEVVPNSKAIFLDCIVGFTCVDGVKKQEERGRGNELMNGCKFFHVR